MMNPMVLDIYHGDVVTDWDAIKAAGIVGVIHKATQGAGVVDPLYEQRRTMATDAGLLFGAYHFNTGADVDAQVDEFFSHASPDDHTLMALDFEDNAASNMSYAQAREFLELADAKLGRKLVLYGGNRIREHVPQDDAFFASHRLWLAQYGPVAVVPHPWSRYWLWQYTGDDAGEQPHGIHGVGTRGIDLNVYDGSAEQLAAEWTLDTPAYRPPMTGGDDVWLQTSLNHLGASPPLVVDGQIGPATEAAIRSFQSAHGLKVDGIAGKLTRAAIAEQLKSRLLP